MVSVHISTTAPDIAGDRTPRCEDQAVYRKADLPGGPSDRRESSSQGCGGRSSIQFRCRRSGGRAITTSSWSLPITAASSSVATGESPRSTSSSSSARPSPARTRRSCSSSARNVQRLQQLGRGQSLRLPRAGQPPGAPRLLQPAPGRTVPPVGAAVRRLGRAERLHAGLLRQQRPRVPSRAPRGVQAGPERRTRRVLVGPDARPA